jgi:imidazole glycerol phosphate synthase subunit HisF
VSLVVGGSIRSSADVVKAIALGADAVYIGTARPAGARLPLVPQLPERALQLGHRDAAAGPR